MTEKQLWVYIKKGMGDRWHAQRHEDMFAHGVPDVSYGLLGVNGWIELKCVKRWPMPPKHLRMTQVNWLTTRDNSGSHCYVLVYAKATNEYRLLTGGQSMALYQGRLISPIKLWRGAINFKEFADVLRGLWPAY